jgi:hypothetical protein
MSWQYISLSPWSTLRRRALSRAAARGARQQAWLRRRVL